MELWRLHGPGCAAESKREPSRDPPPGLPERPSARNDEHVCELHARRGATFSERVLGDCLGRRDPDLRAAPAR